MKFSLRNLAMGAAMAVSSLAFAQGTANPYAYGLTSEFADGKLSVKYSLNAAATSVVINVVDASGAVVATKDAGAQAAGAYTADIEVSTPGTYTWEISVTGAEKTELELFSE